ncbi:MAG: ATP-binding protein [Deferribacteres bacterium]|nr:ATP-binding protein [candidate division KSB1 bacterium]MCB9502496.1 ATP-binding protein [Deferribacteres bacterium]
MKDLASIPELITTKSIKLAFLHKNDTTDTRLYDKLNHSGYEVFEFHSRGLLLSWLQANANLVETLLVELDETPGLLATIANIRDRYPSMPILAVAKECETNYIREAISSGANHFIPESVDPKVLSNTVDRLVNFRMEFLRYVHALPFLKTSLEARIPSRLDLLGGLVYYLTEEMFKHGIITLREINVKVAFVEALTNAVEHGNRLNPEKEVIVRAEFDNKYAKIHIFDEGEGFDFKSLPDPTQKENLFRARGRGVFMMRQFMDDVIFHEPGNHVTLIKYCTGGDITPRPYPWERRMI